MKLVIAEKPSVAMALAQGHSTKRWVYGRKWLSCFLVCGTSGETV